MDTTHQILMEIRELIESDETGNKPLQRHEIHRAYYCITGQKLDVARIKDLSAALVPEVTGLEERPSHPYRKDALVALRNELREQANDTEEQQVEA